MRQLAKRLMLTTIVLALLAPTLALGRSESVRTTGSASLRLEHYRPDDYGTYVYQYKWYATKAPNGEVKGSITQSVTKVLDSGTLQRYPDKTWNVTEVTRLASNSVEIGAPGSEDYDPEWGGTVWRVTDNGKSGDLFSSYCELHSLEQDVWHAIGVPKQYLGGLSHATS